MVKELASGISAHGRSKSYHRRGLWAIKKANGGKVRIAGPRNAARDTQRSPLRPLPGAPSPPPPPMRDRLAGGGARRRTFSGLT